MFVEGNRDWAREEKHLRGWRNSLSAGPYWNIPAPLMVDIAEEGPVLEHISGHEINLVAGHRYMADYTVGGSFRMLTGNHRPTNTDDIWSTVGRVGPIVRMLDQRRYYQLCLEGLSRVVLYRREDEERYELASKSVELSPRKYYRLELSARGERLTGRLDGEIVLEVDDSAYMHGWPGVRSLAVCRMKDIFAETDDADDAVNSDLKMTWEAEQRRARQSVAQAVIRKHVSIPSLARFEGPMVFRMRGIPFFLFTGAGSVVVTDTNGREIWRTALDLTNACIADIDGPGNTRIAGIADGDVVVLDAAGGKELRRAVLPDADPFRQLSGDRINPRFGGVSAARLKPDCRELGLVLRHEAGGGSRRYWACDNELRPLWNTFIPRPPGAHVVHITDVYGRVVDEICTGMHILDHEGNLVWSAPDADIFAPHGGDHIDWVRMQRLDPEQPEKIHIVLATGNEGLFVYDRESRELICQHQFGHVQSVATGHFVPGRKDFQIWAVTRWDSYGISCIVAPDGSILSRLQVDFTSDSVRKVNWTGNGLSHVVFGGRWLSPDSF